LRKVERELNKTLNRLVDSVGRFQKGVIDGVRQLMITLGGLSEGKRADMINKMVADMANEIVKAEKSYYELVDYLVSLRSRLSDVLSRGDFRVCCVSCGVA